MYISIKRHSWFFKSWWCLLYFGHVPTRTIGKCWRQKTPFCLKLSAHAQWRQKPPFCLKLSTHAQKSVLSWSISMSRILDTMHKTYAAFRLTCRLPHCRFDDDICTTAQAPLAAEGWPSGKQRQAASSQLIDNLAALPTAADRRQLNSIQLGSDAARW